MSHDHANKKSQERGNIRAFHFISSSLVYIEQEKKEKTKEEIDWMIVVIKHINAIYGAMTWRR